MSRKRMRARRLAVQALYQWQCNEQAASEIEAQFVEREELAASEADYFHTLLHGVITGCEALDAALTPLLARPLDQVDPVERAVLRLAAFELSHCLDVPYRVVIDQAVELAKTFGAEQGHRFVNGVIDRLATELRASEVAARR